MNKLASAIKSKRQRGFTLIEVMVALMVVGVALPSMLLLIMAQLDGAGSIREKTFAYWIAENELTRIRLRQQYFPDENLSEVEMGDVEMLGQRWRWRLETEATEVENFYRLDMSVTNAPETNGADRDNNLALISGFIGE